MTKKEAEALTANNLKDALWETLKGVQSGDTKPAEADSIAAQAREIIRTVKVQLQVAAQTNRDVPVGVVSFSEE
jgi:hypothetical protein